MNKEKDWEPREGKSIQMQITPPAAPEIEQLEEYDELDATGNGKLSLLAANQTNIPAKTVNAEQLNLENFINISKAHDENLSSNKGKKKKRKKKRTQAEV